MSDLNLFIPITKVDAQQRLVYGVATAEAEDRAGEICDYASTKPLYEKWSREIAQSTGGKSRGNLRAMHGAVAAGKVTALNFNDRKKQIEICAKVVDDAEWNKVQEGVYTGFLQGGTYAKRWTDDDGLTRYTAAPSESSLVDLPCLPEARFEMVKSDGSHVWRRFAKDAGEIAQLAQILGQLEELKGTLLLHANEDGAPAETIAQLHMLVQQAHIILQAMVTGEEADTAAVEAPAGTADKRVLAAFGKTGARNSAADLPTMPANYTKKRRIDSIKTDPSSHILAFTQIGDRFLWRSAPTDVPNATPPTTATLQTLSVPPGVSVDALITAQYGGVSTIVNIALWSPIRRPARS
jgi:hypothetical protein